VWALNGVIVNCEVTQFILVYNLSKFIEYSVIIFYKINISGFKEKKKN
jgi:hypothetical protein